MVGIVPAAGRATRLGSPQTSKELLEVYRRSPPNGPPDSVRAAGDRLESGGASRGSRGPPRPRPVIYRLLDAFTDASIGRAYVVTRTDKEDLRKELGDGGGELPHLIHLVLEDSPAAAYSVAVATREAGDATIALGFPDVLWEAEDAFGRLFAALVRDGADVALGLFPPAPDYRTEGVRIDTGGEVLGFEPPDSARGTHTWTLAVWRPLFSRLLEALVERRYGSAVPATGEHMGGDSGVAEPALPELAMTTVLVAALEAGLRLTGVRISDHPFLDVGSPERLRRARGEEGEEVERGRGESSSSIGGRSEESESGGGGAGSGSGGAMR